MRSDQRGCWLATCGAFVTERAARNELRGPFLGGQAQAGHAILEKVEHQDTGGVALRHPVAPVHPCAVRQPFGRFSEFGEDRDPGAAAFDIRAGRSHRYDPMDGQQPGRMVGGRDGRRTAGAGDGTAGQGEGEDEEDGTQDGVHGNQRNRRTWWV
jgi:hypothetical protein